MKSSLRDTANVNPEASPENLPAVQASTEVAPNDSFFSGGGEVEGDYSSNDYIVPRFNVVQGVGPLSEHFQPGVIVFNKDVDLGTGPQKITLVKLRKQFIEDIEYGSEERPRIVQTLEEVTKLGGFLQQEKWTKGEGFTYFKPSLEATIFLEGDKDNLSFPFEFGDKRYALALWTIQGYAYSETGRQFNTAAAMNLKTGLTQGHWTITPTRKKVGKNMIYVPVAKLAGKNSPEFVAFIKETLSSFGA